MIGTEERPRRSRPRNPRRIALHHLRVVNRNIEAMIAAWNQAGTVWERFPEPRPDPADPNRMVGGAWRRLRPEERHENQPRQWQRLAEFVQLVSGQAADLYRFAVVRGDLARRERRDR